MIGCKNAHWSYYVMANLTQKNYNAIRDHIFDRIHKTGEQVKNDFPNLLRTAIETEAWKHFTDGEGKPFSNLVEWLVYTFPNGASMGQTKHSITYEETLKLTEGVPDVHRVLAQNVPKRKPGPKQNNGKELNPSSDLIIKRSGGSSAVLSIRLAQDKPKFYDAYLRGEYKTISAAATAAGLVKDDLNLRRAKSAFRMMTNAQRKEFLGWIKSPEATKK
jgi:hypothetical protein